MDVLINQSLAMPAVNGNIESISGKPDDECLTG